MLETAFSLIFYVNFIQWRFKFVTADRGAVKSF